MTHHISSEQRMIDFAHTARWKDDVTRKKIAKERGSTDFRLRSDNAKWTLHKVCKLKLASLTF